MARNSGSRPVGGPELTVGVRVLVRRSAGADLTGEVVEDYAAVTILAVVGTSRRRCIGGRSRSTTGGWFLPTPKT